MNTRRLLTVLASLRTATGDITGTYARSLAKAFDKVTRSLDDADVDLMASTVKVTTSNHQVGIGVFAESYGKAYPDHLAITIYPHHSQEDTDAYSRGNEKVARAMAVAGLDVLKKDFEKAKMTVDGDGNASLKVKLQLEEDITTLASLSDKFAKALATAFIA